MPTGTPDLSRRGLLLAGAAAPLLAGAAKAASAGTARDLVLLDPGLRYFNAANIAPAFRSVIEVQERGGRAFQADPSREYRERYPVLADTVRARLAARLNVSPQEIALVRNSSEANSVAVLGLDLKPGDRVLVTEHNHQSTLDSWKLRAKREGLDVVVLPTPVAARTAQEIVDGFARAITPRTRAIFLSHVTNVTGLVYPVAEIAALAKAHGLWLHVDGAQSFGWMQLDLAALGCDSFSGSTHKWLMGPLESGILYVRRSGQDRLSPIMLSHGYWLADTANMATAQRYEILGQRDDPKLDAILATLDARDAIGEAAIERMVRAQAARMKALLVAVPGARFVGSDNPALAGPVITMAFPDRDVTALRRRLWQQDHIATAGASVGGEALIRFSPHIYNSEEEMRFVAERLGVQA